MTLDRSPSVAYHITGPMDPYGSIPPPASPTPVEGPGPEPPPRETTERHRSRMSVVNEDFLDCAMVSSGVTAVVASVQEHSARVVRHLTHPNSMFLPIVSPHLLLHKLLTSSDYAMAAFQIQASVDFSHSATP